MTKQKFKSGVFHKLMENDQLTIFDNDQLTIFDNYH